MTNNTSLYVGFYIYKKNYIEIKCHIKILNGKNYKSFGGLGFITLFLSTLPIYLSINSRAMSCNNEYVAIAY